MHTDTQSYSTKRGDALDQEKPNRFEGVVLQAFIGKGTTARAWAMGRGWKARSVYGCIEHWIEHPERRGKLPRGGIYQAIARDIQNTLGADVVPLEQAADDRPTLERAS